MTDTTDTRRDFEASIKARCGTETRLLWWRDGIGYADIEMRAGWQAWQAATEHATAIERERCAVVCEALKIKSLRLQTGQDDDLSNVILRQVAHSGAGVCAEIIRQGGDT